jgi:hypothetical protein
MLPKTLNHKMHVERNHLNRHTAKSITFKNTIVSLFKETLQYWEISLLIPQKACRPIFNEKI